MWSILARLFNSWLISLQSSSTSSTQFTLLAVVLRLGVRYPSSMLCDIAATPSSLALTKFRFGVVVFCCNPLLRLTCSHPLSLGWLWKVSSQFVRCCCLCSLSVASCFFVSDPCPRVISWEVLVLIFRYSIHQFLGFFDEVREVTVHL